MADAQNVTELAESNEACCEGSNPSSPANNQVIIDISVMIKHMLLMYIGANLVSEDIILPDDFCERVRSVILPINA